MIRKVMPLLIVAILLITSGFKDKTLSVKRANQYVLTIKKIDNVWRVVDSENNGKIKVHRNDKITWVAEGSDVAFQFPGNIAKYFEPETSADSLTGGYTAYLKDGKKLKLKVKGDAPPDTVVYAVFVSADGVFAKGESPPRIVIQ